MQFKYLLEFELQTYSGDASSLQDRMKRFIYGLTDMHLAGRDNNCAEHLSRIPKQLDAESMELKPRIDNRAYQVQVINSHRLEDQSVWDNGEEDVEVIHALACLLE